ncbi:hypothetical protein H7F50_13195 [Novosphingobium flavum]|uniref:Bacterial Pleckstrin homology domain-containing protein n=1 Tax=Novosphingobium aerophilum TaxID=2839843 RepID=A0A7X1F8R4_9SPHN|nr:hypothetical protein [Novosphingobium aerophilum]MBC2652451.1 hypothetical protein [Novosphingobium aerophilum]MBC2662710.1 hypothetical protein [Novosphingobium aerophilum]
MFEETQRFSAVLIGSLTAFTGGLSLTVNLVASPLPWWEAAGVAVLLSLAVLGLLALFRLRTVVDHTAIDIRFQPLGLGRRIARDQIATAAPITYRALADFGGWGVRLGREGWMYNMRGNRAVRIESRDGTVTFIGSGQPEALLAALRAEPSPDPRSSDQR